MWHETQGPGHGRPFSESPRTRGPVARNALLCLVLLGGGAFIPARSEGQLDYPNRYGSMAESMFDMMDAFSSAYQKRTGSQPASPQAWPSGTQVNPLQYLNNPGWGGYGMPGGMGGSPWMPGMGSMMNPSLPMGQFNPWGNPSTWMQSTPWSGGSYWAPQGHYPAAPGGTTWTPPSPPSPLDGSWQGNTGEVLTISQGRFRVYQGRDQYREGSITLAGNYLTMTPDGVAQGRVYEFAEQEGRLVLRDEMGNLLLYRRLQR